jgi:hypothetical protein
MDDPVDHTSGHPFQVGIHGEQLLLLDVRVVPRK